MVYLGVQSLHDGILLLAVGGWGPRAGPGGGHLEPIRSPLGTTECRGENFAKMRKKNVNFEQKMFLKKEIRGPLGGPSAISWSRSLLFSESQRFSEIL